MVQGAKAAYYDVMVRANSSSDPADIQVGSSLPCHHVYLRAVTLAGIAKLGLGFSVSQPDLTNFEMCAWSVAWWPWRFFVRLILL